LSLNEKQAAFVREYLVDLNATQAASRAGYSEKTAHSQGQRLLKNAEVRKAINAGKSRRAERVEVSADEVLRELMRLGFSDIANIFNPDGDLRAFRNIPEDTRRAISSIKVKSHTEPGDEDTVVWTTEFKAAAERLAQLSGGAGTTANAAAQSKGDSTASLGPDGDESE
jgi:phage terminase small subunit